VAEIVMPRLSDSMEEGTILKWLKAPGDAVSRGEPLVEIETDKANMTYESDADGVLEIVAAEGDTLPIGAVIARLNGNIKAASAATEEAVVVEPSPAPPAGVAGSAPSGGADDGSSAAAQREGAGSRVKASPVARRIAKERGVELSSVTGSGPGGRIVRADVEGAQVGAEAEGPVAAPNERIQTREAGAATGPGVTGGEPASTPAPAPEPASPVAVPDPTTAKGEVTIQELTRTQQVIARRMSESKATVPEFTLTTDVDMEAAVDMRRQLKEMARDGAVPSYNDMVVKACGIALREHPRANGSYRDGHFELHSRVNVGIAVAAADSLVVPTVFDVDAKTLEAIAGDSRTLAERVREGTITPPELSGATFTVSNLGMFGVTSFTAVINPPQAAILAVGAVAARAVAARAVARDGVLSARATMSMTLACDHRILYGAPAAEFLARVKELLERPLELVLQRQPAG
jgi:pyruvate dehydrogenase E2 component (dihydrolipoamide acetyltransferase)